MQDRRMRRVVVLGRSASLDVEAVVGGAVRDGLELVFLSLGYPVAANQAELVERAIERSVELGVRFEAVLVVGVGLVGRELGALDRVTLAASGRERRRLKRQIRRQAATSDVR